MPMLTEACVGLADMDSRARRFVGSRGVRLSVPQFVGGSSAPHYEFQAPIKQLCFAGNPYLDEPSNRMTVRHAYSEKHSLT